MILEKIENIFKKDEEEIEKECKEKDSDLNKLAICCSVQSYKISEFIFKTKNMIYAISYCYRNSVKGYTEDDLYSEFVEKIIYKIKKYNSKDGNVKSWVRKLCKNHMLDLAKASKRVKRTGIEIDIDSFNARKDSGEVNYNSDEPRFDPRESIHSKLDYEKKIKEIKKLCNAEKKKIIDMLVNEFSQKEISKELKISERKVQTKVDGIRKITEKKLKEDFPMFRIGKVSKVRKNNKEVVIDKDLEKDEYFMFSLNKKEREMIENERIRGKKI